MRLFAVCLRCLAALILGVPLRSAAGGAAGETYDWRNVPVLGGGYVTGLVYHPRDPGLLYARTDVGGVYRRDDARGVWVPLTDMLDRTSGELMGVLSVALDPSDPDRLYLAGGSYYGGWAQNAAILRSMDRGTTWDIVGLPFKLGGNQDGRGTGERLAVDPHAGDILLLGTSRDGLWRSGDAGLSWQRCGDLPRDASITFVLFDPAGGENGRPTQTVYLGLESTTGPSVWRSRSAGQTWRALPPPPKGWVPHHAALDARGRLLVTLGNGSGPNDVTAGAVWRFDPAAEGWTDISPVQPGAGDKFGYAGLALDANAPGVVLVSTLDRWTLGDEIFRSEDAGATWTPLLARSTFDAANAPYARQLKPHWISDVALDPHDSGRAWFVTGYGVWTTGEVDAKPEAPITWRFGNDGLEETVIDELVSPSAGAALLSAMGDLGGFRHDDLTASPAAGFFQPLRGSSPGIDFAANAPGKIVRTHWGESRGALSTDGGVTWRDFAATPPAAVKHGPGLVAISADGTRLVWLPKGAKPHFSTDDGATWHEGRAELVANTDWATYGPVADRVNAQRFYIYDRLSGDFHASTDGGESFAKLNTLPIEGGILRSEPGAEGGLWLPTQDGLWHSTDGGKTFRTIPRVESAHQVGFGAPKPGNTRPTIYLDGTVDGHASCFRSDDGGGTWVRIGDDRRRYGWLRCLTGDARVYGRVYLGTSGRGIIVGEPRWEN